MDTKHIILTLAAAQFAIAMAPGPNTVLILQSAIHDRKFGLAVAVGYWPGGLFWAIIGLVGISTLSSTLPALAVVLRLLCGAYLVWLGVKAISRSFKNKNLLANISANKLSLWESFRAGFISAITNPKGIPYFASIFSATGAAALPLSGQIFAVIMMPTISFLWYSSLALVASHASVQRIIEKSRHWLDRIAEMVMIGFGVSLFAQ